MRETRLSTVIVLGAGGFLAGYVQRHFAELGWRVVAVGREPGPGIDGSARHAWSLPHAEFAHLLAVEQPDLCVNAAGRSSVAASMVEPLADFEASAVLNFKVLDDMRRRSPRTAYVQLSSAAVYGNPAALPVGEDVAAAPISPYGWHKRLSEMVLHEHASQFGLRTASLRIFSAYGVGLRRQVVWDLARRAIVENDDVLTLHGCPEDSRDFVHAVDVARAIELVATRGPLTGESYNLASGRETPIAEVARLVLEQVSPGRRIEFDANRRPGDPARWHADISRIAALGFAPTVAFADGVAEVVAEARATRG